MYYNLYNSITVGPHHAISDPSWSSSKNVLQSNAKPSSSDSAAVSQSVRQSVNHAMPYQLYNSYTHLAFWNTSIKCRQWNLHRTALEKAPRQNVAQKRRRRRKKKRRKISTQMQIEKEKAKAIAKGREEGAGTVSWWTSAATDTGREMENPKSKGLGKNVHTKKEKRCKRDSWFPVEFCAFLFSFSHFPFSCFLFLFSIFLHFSFRCSTICYLRSCI